MLAAAGDARVIALYDVASGEQVALLTGHVGWIFSLDWNSTGEYVLSGYVSAALHDFPWTTFFVTDARQLV